MSASFSASVNVCSHSAGFGSAVRLLSRLSVSGNVVVSVCPYTGVAYCEALLLPAVGPLWPAVLSLAFGDGRSEGDADHVWLADVKIGGDNARYFALEALLASVGA